MPRGFYCQFDYIVSFKALERHIMKKKKGLRLLTKTNKRKEPKGGATPPENKP